MLVNKVSQCDKLPFSENDRDFGSNFFFFPAIFFFLAGGEAQAGAGTGAGVVP